MALEAPGRLVESTFRAMGTDVHIALNGGDDELVHRGERHVRGLEQRWSRFLATSEISARLNRYAGHPVAVSPETFDLVARAVFAWHATDGRFDPTVGAALAAHGYDRDFATVAGAVAEVDPAGLPAPGAAAIELVPECNSVALPTGTSFDAGGIGKGHAADLTAGLLVAAGADGALVNIGGDLRALGRAPAPEGWPIAVADPLDGDRELLRVAIAHGALATSSRLRRRWRTSHGEAHHLIDPRMGRPAQTDVVAVTVVAAEAWWAEVLTKALFLTGPAGLAGLDAAHAVVVMRDGARHCTADLQATLR